MLEFRVGHEHHHHDHHHGHTHGISARGALTGALVLQATFLVVELGAGWVTGSLALLSDAAHMVSDVSALVLALGAANLARRRATTGTYGLARAEVLGAFVNAVALLGVCAWIVFEAVGRLFEGAPPVPAMPVLWVGAAGFVLNLGSAWVLHRSDHDNLNIRGALLHLLADALGSLAAIGAAVAMMYGIPAADPIASLAVAALVTVGTVRLLRDAGRVLLELPPAGVDVQRVREALHHVEGVTDVHDLHIWSIDGRSSLVSAHLVVGEATPFEGACERAHHLLDEKFGVHHATLQVERPGSCGGRCH
jgi:cobalt-zinc-cadmium efflux system protein